jgi:hypothetical protein
MHRVAVVQEGMMICVLRITQFNCRIANDVPGIVDVQSYAEAAAQRAKVSCEIGRLS